MWHVLIVLALLFACVNGVRAQQSADPAKPVTNAVVSTPVMDPAVELKGAQLLKTLREGGNILFMRHAEAGSTAADCPGESTLTPKGMEQARTVGEAIGRLRLPISVVQASALCRTRQTATLMNLGGVALNVDLNPGWMRREAVLYPQRFNYLLVPPPAGNNVMLVSHVQGSKVAEEGILIDLAEIVVYRGVVNARALPVARIKVNQWAELLMADGQKP